MDPIPHNEAICFIDISPFPSSLSSYQYSYRLSQGIGSEKQLNFSSMVFAPSKTILSTIEHLKLLK